MPENDGALIESGSLTPGVSVEEFGLPPGTALRLELPSPPLADAITDYHVFDSDPVAHPDRDHVILPSWPVVRFAFSRQRIGLSIGPRDYSPVPPAALYGTITRAQRLTSHGGVTVGAGISPIGWSRLFRASAADLRDRAVSLDRVWPSADIRAVYDQLASSDLARDVKPILDGFLATRLGQPSRDEVYIRRFAAILREEGSDDLATIADKVGVSAVTLRRLSTRYFGFPPKILLIRARFIRSIVRMLLSGDPTPNYELMSPAYFDIPHFLRDADRFLGMTPRRLLEQDNAYLIATLRARYALLRAAER